ncbi:MAG: hypothetical protein E7292_02150 [Lachnospiraceae bacterium]|nr:hypothetical protein [Lachnospiraceae bacterium]
MQFGDMPDMARNFLFIWLIVIFILGLYNLFRSVQVKEKRHIVISTVLLVIEYLLLQIAADISHRNMEMEHVGLSDTLGRIGMIWWIVLIAGIMAISITLASYFRHWKKEHITPMSVKDSMDMLHAGLCYWEEGGRIILSNKKMDEICLAITGEMLLNGEKFYKQLDAECVSMPDGTIKFFSHNQVAFADKQIYELVAADVTELYKKNELLEQETQSLRKMNESLRRYNQNIEEMVRKQEILDTKVYIHDEMNRLMLLTTANAETPMSEEDFKEILTLWRNNAILLGTENNKTKVNTDITEVNQLAELLGVRLIWEGEQASLMPDTIREVFIMVAREAIANAVKHAEAKNITIGIHKKEDKLCIGISNDGRVPGGKISPGGGLSNIKRMVEQKRGRFKVEVNEAFKMTLEFETSRLAGAK